MLTGDVNLFLKKGRDSGKLMFFNNISLYAIIGCIFSSADEVRNISYIGALKFALDFLLF